ncbi:MAG: hypothetical protein PUB86_02545 [Elusimicrobia bacterium]|nr:hypothetical protein [Elusimicrobiota bacterium]
MNRIDIINLALRRLKQTALKSLNDASLRSEDIQSLYENTLDGLLARRNFSFALKDALLFPLKDENNVRGEHKKDIFGRYIYPLPKDFIRKSFANRPGELFAVWADGIHSSGPKPIKMLYVFKQRDEQKFSAYFINALVAALCFNCSDKLNLSSEDKNAFWQECEAHLEEAGRIDAFNMPVQRMPKSDFELAHEEY